MNEKEVRAVFEAKLELVKPYLKDGVIEPSKENVRPKWPELWEGYDQCIEDKYDLSVHIEKGAKADKLFLNRAPNQTPEELDYVKSNFKQTTLPIYRDYENTFRRALHESNWSLKFKEDERGKDFENYVNDKVEEFDSVLNWFRLLLPKIKTLDPMGVVAVMPAQLPVIEDGEGNTVIDPSERVEPQIHYFEVCDLWGFRYDKFYLLKKREKSLVTYGNQTKKAGLILWLIDDTTCWRIEQYGKQIEWTFKITAEFVHNVGYPPVQNLMGDPYLNEGRMLWASPYMTGKDLLDIALMDAQYLQVSKVNTNYPYRIMLGDDCMFVDEKNGSVNCNGGSLYYPRPTEEDPSAFHRVKCPECHGTGTKARVNPMGTLVVKAATNSITGETVGNVAGAMAFVSPEVAGLEFARTEIDKQETRVRKIMHLSSDQPIVGGDQKTATEAGIDLKASMAFRKPIIEQMFIVLDGVLDEMQRIRYGPDADLYELIPPTNLDIRTDQERLDEIGVYRQQGMPQPVIDDAIWQYLVGRYQSNPKTLQAFAVIMKADRLFGMTPQQIAMDLSKALIAPWEVVLDESAMLIYERLAEDPAWENKDIKEKVADLQAEAKKITPTQPAPAANPAMDRLQAAKAA